MTLSNKMSFRFFFTICIQVGPDTPSEICSDQSNREGTREFLRRPGPYGVRSLLEGSEARPTSSMGVLVVVMGRLKLDETSNGNGSKVVKGPHGPAFPVDPTHTSCLHGSVERPLRLSPQTSTVDLRDTTRSRGAPRTLDCQNLL